MNHQRGDGDKGRMCRKSRCRNVIFCLGCRFHLTSAYDTRCISAAGGAFCDDRDPCRSASLLFDGTFSSFAQIRSQTRTLDVPFSPRF